MTQPSPAHSSRPWAWALLIVLLLGLRLPALERPTGGDQQLYTYVGQRLLRGEVPYRDAFEQKPPGVFAVYAGVWAVWPRESAAAVADLAAAALVCLLLVTLGRRAFGGRVGEGAAILFLVLGDPGIQRLGGMNVRAQCETFIGVAVSAALVLAWRAPAHTGRLVAAGALVAGAVWLKYNAIVFAIPVVAAALLSGGGWPGRGPALRIAGWLAIGAAAVTLPTLGYFAAAGAMTDLWLATVTYNVQYSRETYEGVADALRYPFTMPILRARVDGLWFIGLLGSVLLAASFNRRRGPAVMALLWIGAAVLSIALNGARGLPQYFLQALPALALAGAAGLEGAWRDRGRRPAVAAGVAALLVFGVWRVGAERVAPLEPRLFGLPQSVSNLRHDLAYLRGVEPRAAYLARFDRGDGGKFSPAAVERLAAHVSATTGADDPILVFGFAAGGVLSRAGRPSASRFFWSRPVVIEFASDRPGFGSAGLLADVQRRPPAVVALQKFDWGLAETTTPNSIEFFLTHPALKAWLDAGYAFDYEDAAFAVWKRRP